MTRKLSQKFLYMMEFFIMADFVMTGLVFYLVEMGFQWPVALRFVYHSYK